VSRGLASDVLGRREDLVHQFDELRHVRQGGRRIRCHGDYHLGQVLVSQGDIVILDFEGEPARPLAERRLKTSPLRDVAGMFRSFSYAAMTGLNVAAMTRPDDRERLAPWADFWETWASAVFLRAYLKAAPADVLPPSRTARDVLLHAFVADKALYELGYELNSRPEWVHIPLSGLLRIHETIHA
jgi:maltose alpha-D-glucosyltransferase/alpha-amylase